MPELFAPIAAWWRGDDLVMPAMLAVATVLWLLIGERAWVLFRERRSARRDELETLLGAGGGAAWRTWAARYVGVAEEARLTRGLGLIRVLTACLPLLGLLGTVGGMIDGFAGMAGAVRGSGGIAREAGAGIGLALAATQYGIALAVPAVVAEWLLRRRAESLAHDREQVARGLVAEAAA